MGFSCLASDYDAKYLQELELTKDRLLNAKSKTIYANGFMNFWSWEKSYEMGEANFMVVKWS